MKTRASGRVRQPLGHEGDGGDSALPRSRAGISGRQLPSDDTELTDSCSCFRPTS